MIYKLLFWWGSIRRQSYIDAENLEDALRKHKESDFGTCKVISIVESEQYDLPLNGL